MAKNGHISVISRYEKVIATLFKYGFEDIVAHPPFSRFLPKLPDWISTRDGKLITEYTRYERMRMVCEELGTTFIKFAQIASNRPDLLPEELIEELEKFQDHNKTVAWEEIEAVLKSQYALPLEELFTKIDRQPLASASIAQVHLAQLKNGQEVVLKIQRPGIEETIEADIKILKQLSEIFDRYFPQYQSFQPKELVKMFEKSIRKELKFTIEAGNLQRFAANFKNREDIYVPIFFPEFSTDKVLCMEYIQGLKCTDLAAVNAIGMTGPQLALKGINLYFEQVFDHGFFHADPHPGNIFVLKDRRVCFIDYGMMGTVLESDKILLADLLLAVHDRDVEYLKKSLLKFSSNEKAINQKELEYDILEFFAEYSNITLDAIEGEEVIKALNSLFFDYKIKVPSNMLLLLKALVIIEGVGLMLDPKYNIIKNIEPFVRRLIQHKYAPSKISKSLFKSIGDFAALATSLPEDLQAVIKKVRQGKLHVEFEHTGLETFYKKMETISNRISFTLLLVALIIGSSILVIADVPPHINNIPALGFTGFVLAGFFAVRLIWSIWRHGDF